MTLPTITYGQGWQDDCSDDTGWNETEDGMIASLSVSHGTVFDIDVTAAVGNKTVYYQLDIPNISSTTYSKFMVRYKTSDTNIKAQVDIVFTAGSQTVMAQRSSTTWDTYTNDITPGNTISQIRIWAKQATGNVYFDFIMLYTGTQTFNNYDLLDMNPRVKKSTVFIPNRDTNIKQHLGRDNTLILIEGPMHAGKTWGGSRLTYGEYFMYVLQEPYFQWFTSDLGNFKVMPVDDGFHLRQSKTQGYQVHYSLLLEEQEAGNASVFGNPAWCGV